MVKEWEISGGPYGNAIVGHGSIRKKRPLSYICHRTVQGHKDWVTDLATMDLMHAGVVFQRPSDGETISKLLITCSRYETIRVSCTPGAMFS